AAQLLSANRIPCELRNKPNGFVSFLSPGIINIVLVVQEEDVERACDILGFTQDADEPDDDVPPQEAARPAPQAIRGESPPPVSEPRHIKRQTQTVQPESEAATVEPAVKSPPVESPQVVEQAPQEDDESRGAP